MEMRFLLGQMLLNDNLISQAQLDHALKHQRQTKKPLGEVLVELGFLDAKVVQDALKRQRSVKIEECTKIGVLLVRDGVISYHDLFSALEHQQRSPGTQLGSILLRAGKVTKEDLAAALKAQKRQRSSLGRVLSSRKDSLDALASELEAAYHQW